MEVRRLKNEEQKSKEETEKKKPDLRFFGLCDVLGLFVRKPERGGERIGNQKKKKEKEKEDTAPMCWQRRPTLLLKCADGGHFAEPVRVGRRSGGHSAEPVRVGRRSGGHSAESGRVGRRFGGHFAASVHHRVSSFLNRIDRYLSNRSSIVTNSGLDSNDWSQLHIDFVSQIVNRLHSFEDFMAAAGISRIWRSACFATAITRPHQLPWLMLSESPHTHRRRFFSLLYKNGYQLPLSKALCGKRCWGSQHNWVVALGPDYKAHLVPLGKGEPIALPSLDTIRGDAPEEWFRLAHKFILFEDPSHVHGRSFLVFAIFSPMNCLAFARVGEGAALNRRGQDEWVIVTSPDNLKFKDVACLNDQIYGLCDEGTLVHFELDAPLLPEVQVIASHQLDVREPRQLYLVESLGRLYTVFRNGYLIPSQRRHVTTSFLVYMFNFSALAFENVRDLEGHAFFVGDGNSWSIPTSTIPAITNRIYFTDDHWDWPMYLGGAYGGRDLGGFDIENGDMQSLPSGKASLPSHSRPILVTPPIRLD